MKLYAFPMSCSFAAHVALAMARLPFEVVWVGLPGGELADGGDYRQVNPRMQVPSLHLGEQGLLTETPAILQYVADLVPETGLAPAAGTLARARLQEALNYMSSEVHKQVLWPLSNLGRFPADPAALGAMLVDLLRARLDYLSGRLGARLYLIGERFTVADAFMLVMLHWAGRREVDVRNWPNLADYQERLLALPEVAEVRAVNLAQGERILAAGGRI